jgi:hypothetical protein
MVAQLMNEKGSLNQSFSLKKERKKIEIIIIIIKKAPNHSLGSPWKMCW